MDTAEKQKRASVVIAECMRRADAGKSVNVQQVLTQHPELADELKAHFDAEHMLESVLADVNVAAIRRSDIPRSKRSTAAPGASDSVPTGGDSFDNLPVEFGRYRIQKVLGQGAMGAVYLAHDTKLARDVALKTPKLDVFADGELVERFEREARAAATLHHRNICPVFDVGEIDGIRFLTMAYIEGKPLSAFVSEDRSMSRRQAATVVRKLAMGLNEAHAQGVVHRDLKPANVMIDKSGEPVVMDFGLAHQAENAQKSRLTGVGVLMGSPAYMSPEQVRGKPDAVGHSTDIYSLGVVLFELLTGQLPFDGGVAAIIGQILTSDPPDVRSLRPVVDEDLAQICSKMMAKSPAERFASMKEVADALGVYLRDIRKNTSAKTDTQSIVTSDVIFDDAVIGSMAVSAAKPKTGVTRYSFSATTIARAKWIGGGLLGLGLLAGVIIKFKNGTTLEISDGNTAIIETSKDGSLKSVSVTSIAADADQPRASATYRESIGSTVQQGAITIPTQGHASQLAVSPNGNHVVATGADSPGRFTVWDTQNGNQIVQFDDPSRPGLPTSQLSYSPDGSSLLYCTGNNVRVVSVADGAEQATFDFPAPPTLVVFPKRTIALALYYEQQAKRKQRSNVTQRLRIWDWQKQIVLHDDVAPNQLVSYAAVSPDERFVTLSQEHQHVRYTVVIDGDAAVLTTPTEFEQTSRVRGPLVFSLDSRYAATSVKNSEYMAAVLDVLTGRVITRLDPATAKTDNEGHQYGCRLGFGPDGTQIVMADHTGRAALWDVATGEFIEELEQFQKEGNHSAPGVAVSRNGVVILGGGTADRRITVRDLHHNEK